MGGSSTIEPRTVFALKRAPYYQDIFSLSQPDMRRSQINAFLDFFHIKIVVMGVVISYMT